MGRAVARARLSTIAGFVPLGMFDRPVAVTIAAAYLPARRTSRLDPLRALRDE